MKLRTCALLALTVVLFSGCGRNLLQESDDAYEILKAEYLKKQVEEVEIYEPVPVDYEKRNFENSGLGAARRHIAENMKDAGKRLPKRVRTTRGNNNPDIMQEDMVQFSSIGWEYHFSEPEVEDNNFTAEIEARQIETWYDPIPVRTYRGYEAKTGEYYDPRNDRAEGKLMKKVKRLSMRYNPDKRAWEIAEEKISWQEGDDEEYTE